MKPWQINLIAIIVLVLVAVSGPDQYPGESRDIIAIIIGISAIWVYFDARKLDVTKYQTKGFLSPGSTPGSIATVTLLFWIIGFPLYVSYRQKIIDGKVPLKNAEITAPTTTNTVQ